MRLESRKHEKFDEIRRQFPILKKKIAGKRYIYLDSAATTLKPSCVIESVSNYYKYYYANVHRGAYYLSQKASQQYEHARETLKRFFNAGDEYDVIFTSGATEAVNLVVNAFCEPLTQEDDIILVSILEHHSNFLPWKLLASRSNAELKILPLKPSGDFSKAELKNALSSKIRFAALTHASNVTGKLQNLQSVVSNLQQSGAMVLIDGAQSASHFEIDLESMKPDFFVCSAHKMLGPTGVGAVILKKQHLENAKPWKTGGGMVLTAEPLSWREGVRKFEAGTPHFVGVYGWMRALDFLNQIGLKNTQEYVSSLTAELLEGLKQINGIRIFASDAPRQNAGIVSFLIDDIHPHDIAAWLDYNAIAVRDGHHCAQPLMEYFGVPSVVRASAHLYNTKEDISQLLSALNRLVDNQQEIFDRLYGKDICNFASEALQKEKVALPDIEIRGIPDYCGDLLRLCLKVNDQKVTVETEADICIPCRRSLNIMLTRVQNKPIGRVYSLCKSAIEALATDNTTSDINGLNTLRRIKENRLSCITLPWKTMLCATEKYIHQPLPRVIVMKPPLKASSKRSSASPARNNFSPVADMPSAGRQ
ncbi:MAG: aminotransferase class V-fold PLP-dependent enzyme [Planctomycetota bacterium]